MEKKSLDVYNKRIKIITQIIVIIFVALMLMVLGISLGFAMGKEYYSINTFYSADEFLNLGQASLEELDGKEMRISDVYVEEVVTGSTGMFVETDVGTVFFEDDEDALKVRAGETFIFKGRLSINLDEETSFYQSDYIMRKGDWNESY